MEEVQCTALNFHKQQQCRCGDFGTESAVGDTIATSVAFATIPFLIKNF